MTQLTALALAVTLCAEPTAPYQPGEQMSFSVSYLGIKAGEARIWVGQRAGPTLPIFLQARSAGIASIATLKQQLVSYLDVATGLPRSCQVDGLEGSWHHVDTTRYDRVKGIAEVRERARQEKTYQVEIPPGVLDFLSLVFRLRTLPLEDGGHHEFQVLAGRDVFRVRATVEAREVVKTDAGDFHAVKVRVPTGFSGKFSEKSPSFIWFSDDERRIIVKITSDFAVGHATAILTDYRPAGERRP